MNPQRWQQVKDVFHSAVDRADMAERMQFLAEAFAGDADLRVEVEALIAAHEAADTFIERPAMMRATDLIDKAEVSLEGMRVGTYRLVREIGQGGMGAVYLAVRDDDEYRKEVAVKVIKRGVGN